jgi:hypothetical protein
MISEAIPWNGDHAEKGTVVRRIDFRYLGRSMLAPIGLLTLTIGILALVIASPIILKQVAKISGMNWTLLSNIGQTYGAVSALLSALALGGVVISTLYQVRDVGTAREQAARAVHFELLKMEMDDPEYMEVLAGPYGESVGLNDYDSLRKDHLVHMWVTFWEGRYELHEMSDENVRGDASDLFRSVEGRRYWLKARNNKLTLYKGRRHRFARMVDEEYRKAVAAGPPVVVKLQRDSDARIVRPGSSRISRMRTISIICGTAGAAIVAERLLSRLADGRCR